jgi:hypothetical protein
LKRGGVLPVSELQRAFDAALDRVGQSIATGMTTIDGAPARPLLERLEAELKAQRREALDKGAVDRSWFQRTVRWMDEWVPETEITLIAALGRIARAGPGALS